MSITSAKQSSFYNGVIKYDTFRAGLPFTPTIGTATDGGTGSTASVTFTANGNTAGTTYTALSSPGSLTASGTSSPITVSGLTSGTAYTFQVSATNSVGTSPYSAASNSVTPVTPSSYESIASFTPTGTSTVTFSSIPSTYTSLQIRMSGLTVSAGYDFILQLNGDTGNNYARHSLYGNGSTATATATTATSRIIIDSAATGTYTTSPMVAIIDIHNYASTTQNKTVRSFEGSDNNGTGDVTLVSGLWLNTAAVTSATISVLGGINYAAGTTIALYGIKGA